MNLSLLAIPAALLVIGATDVPRDWAATLRTDAQAYHDQIADNHPGPYNKLDPDFARRNDAGLASALRRAATVRDYPGYLWAMRGYVASFNDGHVALDLDQPAPLPIRWPGFLTGFDGTGRQVVMTRADDVPLPLGAVLESCDGIDAEHLAARNVGAFRGRWELVSQRATNGGRLFLDAANPYIKRPVRCSFKVDGKLKDVTLSWRDLPDADLDTPFAATAPRAHPEFAARTLADGTRWFSLPGFNGDPDSADAKSLTPIIKSMRKDAIAIAAAPRIVLDLRGNGGGSSDWSYQIAAILWGQAAVNALPSGSEGVDWRASAGNIATLEGYRTAWQNSADVSQAAKDWAVRTAKGMTSARALGQALWREIDADEAKLAATSVAPVLKARVFVLTDWGCGSACLDAVDLWTALGGIHVGQETSADSLYMDVRQVALPSGFARAVIPMKVYRGRKRGSNVPARPAHAYKGDMRNTDQLERWIIDLKP
jgi:hypothetical protein